MTEPILKFDNPITKLQICIMLAATGGILFFSLVWQVIYFFDKGFGSENINLSLDYEFLLVVTLFIIFFYVLKKLKPLYVYDSHVVLDEKNYGMEQVNLKYEVAFFSRIYGVITVDNETYFVSPKKCSTWVPIKISKIISNDALIKFSQVIDKSKFS